MSLFPLDVDRYKRWTIRQLYALLKPYILEDCVCRRDFDVIFVPGNLIAPPDGGPVTYIVPSTTRIGADILIAAARVEAEEGRATLVGAQGTGEFLGS